MLRLATKYEVSHLRTQAVEILSIPYPRTLEGWRTRDANMSAHKLGKSYLDSCFSVANVVQETEVIEVLPAALLECCNRPIKTIVGSLCGTSPPGELNATNKQAVLIARPLLSSMATKKSFLLVFKGRRPSEDACEQEEGWCAFIAAAFKDMYGLETQTGWFNPLLFIDIRVNPCEFCNPCRQRFADQYIEGCHSVWSDLPSVFGLRIPRIPEWTEGDLNPDS